MRYPQTLGRLAFSAALLLAGGMAIGAMTQGQRGDGKAMRPQRIVSVNLCADQYLLELADPAQIAGVTRNATDPDMSAAAAKARGVHVMRQSAEEVLAIDPDLVIGFVARRGLGGMIADRDFTMLELDSANDYPTILRQIRMVARAVGHPERGEAMIARMNRELAALPRLGAGKVAAYYQRRGYMTGTGTLVDDLMKRVGLVNLAGRLGKPPLSQLSLEEMIAARPDYLIVESATDHVADKGTEMLHHPILKDIPRLRVPEAWTVCGGPAYVRAVRTLTEQLRAAHRPRR
jgi:iron complex transport system substrate-binding protein